MIWVDRGTVFQRRCTYSNTGSHFTNSISNSQQINLWSRRFQFWMINWIKRGFILVAIVSLRMTMPQEQTRAPFLYKNRPAMYGDSHNKDKTVARPSYLYNGNPSIARTVYLYWDDPLYSGQGSDRLDWSSKVFILIVFYPYFCYGSHPEYHKSHILYLQPWRPMPLVPVQ